MKKAGLVIGTFILLCSPSVCLGASEKVLQGFARVGRVGAAWTSNFISHIPSLTWSGVILPFAIGIVATFVLWRFLPVQRLLTFVQIFEHEVVHGLTAIACGGSFKSLTVSLQGGMAEVTKSNILVRLAPYCMPLLCAATLLIVHLLNPDKKLYGLVLAGILYGNFVSGTFSTIGIQPDIKKSGGKWLCYPLILVANMVMTMMLAFILLKI